MQTQMQIKVQLFMPVLVQIPPLIFPSQRQRSRLMKVRSYPPFNPPGLAG